MSATNEALARRWMASKHWGGWRRGMLSSGHGLCIQGDGYPLFVLQRQIIEPRGAELPCLDHPSTRAFLLEDVRRAWQGTGGGFPVARPGPLGWFIEAGHRGDLFKCPGLDRFGTEAEALIEALEAAP